MKRISVCMATYNGANFISNQVHSILEQLAPADELIISDDASIDDTLKIICEFNDPRIRILPVKRVASAILNFENAIRHAHGDLIFLADQDDIWLPGKVEKMVKALEHADLVLSDCCVVNEQGDIIHKSFFEHRNSRSGIWRNLWKNSYMGCCMAFQRDVLAYCLPFPAHIHMHDWWLGLMVECRGRVLFLKEPLLKYVRHGSNVSPTGEGKYGWGKRFLNRFWMAGYVLSRTLS